MNDPSGLYHGPSAVFTACISCFMLWTRPSSVSILCLRTRLSSVSVDILVSCIEKKPLMASYGQNGRWEDERAARGPVHGQPFETCEHGMTKSGQDELCAAKSERGTSAEQKLQVAIVAGQSD